MPESRETVRMVDRDGNIVEVPTDGVDYAKFRGYREATSEDASARAQKRARDLQYGSTAGQAAAGGAGFARGLTGGVSDALAADTGTVSAKELRGFQEANPITSTVGEVAGALLPVAPGKAAGGLRSALKSTPVGLAEGLGRKAAAKVGGGVRGAAAHGVVEGAVVGAGSGVSELALSDDPLTVERIASTLSSRALLGGAVGGGAGVFAKAAEKGLSRAARAIEARASAVPTSGTQVVDDLAAYSKARDGAFLIAKGEQKAVLAKQARRVRDALDAPETLAKRPQQLAATLEKETKVLRELVEEGQDETLKKLADSDRRVAAAVRERLSSAKPDAKTIRLDRKMASEYRDVAGIGGKGSIKLPIDKAQEFVTALETGELAAARQSAIEGLPDLLEQNMALRSAIDAGMASKPGGALSQAQGLAAGYAIPAVAGLLPGGMVGAAGAMVAPRLLRHLDELVTKRLGKASGEITDRATTAVSRALGIAAEGAGKSAPAATVSAAKVLTSTSFAPEKPDREKKRYAPTKDKLVTAFRNRSDELLSQVQAGPTPGTYQMRPAARKAVADRLVGVRAVSPVMADRLETVIARRVEYLASKLPKRPDVAGIPIGPDRWRPSDRQIREFARHVQAVEDPASVAERIADGRVTRADVEALRSVYPEQLAAMQRQIVENLPKLRKDLPYETKLALSIVTGVPVVPATAPRILAVLQAQYAAEPGTEGGQHPPRAQPQFGSVSKQPATQAQRRASPDAA